MALDFAQRLIPFSLTFLLVSLVQPATADNPTKLGAASDLKKVETAVKNSDVLVVGPLVEPFQLSPGIKMIKNIGEEKQLPNKHREGSRSIELVNEASQPIKVTLLMPVSDIDNPNIQYFVNEKISPSIFFLGTLGKSASMITQKRYRNAFWNGGSQLFSYLGAVQPSKHKRIKIVYEPTKAPLPEYCRLIVGYSECVEDVEECSKSIRKGTAGAETYVRRGKDLLHLDEYELAIDDFSKAIELNAGLISAYRGRASAYTQLGQAVLAAKDSKTASKIEHPN